MPKKTQILSVRIERVVDENPDLSHLGEYSDTPGPNAIDRRERGDAGAREYRYCNITMSAAETGNPESVEQDYQRMQAYNRFEWWMIGIIAKAKVKLANSDVIQTIHSGGLWGIESDAGDDYFAEVEANELAQLKDELKAVGCTDRQIDHAFSKVTKP